MRYATYDYQGRRRVGRAEGDRLVPLVGITELGLDTPSEVLDAAALLPDEAIDLSQVKLAPVVPNPDKIICVGLNYHAHVGESKRDLPTYPVLFNKFASSLIGAHDAIELPPESSQVDYEGELAVIIGRAGRRIARERALDHVLGYCTANDVTMRDYQYKTHQWLQGKAWDRSTPMGPYLVTPSEVELANAGIRTILNGELVQSSDLSHLIFDVPTLIAAVSEFTNLLPGDVILTGTPGGVGYRRDPQVFLRDGDEISVEIDGIGTLRNRVRAES
jgi:acylpyruvate hydrolase